jgi:hypothetical protein
MENMIDVGFSARYKNEYGKLFTGVNKQDRRVSFSTISNILRLYFKIPDLPIVIKLNKKYYSTNFKWPDDYKVLKNEIQVWHQIESSVEDSANSSFYLPHLFKLQRPDGKINCLGLFISPKVCLIPKSKKFSDEDIEKLKNYKIVFFQKQDNFSDVDQEFNLTDLNIVKVLGDKREDNPFFIIQFHRGIDRWAPVKPSNKTRIRGNIVFFNKETQMLCSERTTYVEADGLNTIFYRTENNNMLPGAIFVKDNSEIIGIFTGVNSEQGGGKHFAQIDQIYKWISDLLKEALQNNDRETRNFLLDIYGVEVVIPEILEVLKKLMPVKPRAIEVFNPLHGAF